MVRSPSLREDGFWFLNPMFPTIEKLIVVDVVSSSCGSNTRWVSTQFGRVLYGASVVDGGLCF